MHVSVVFVKLDEARRRLPVLTEPLPTPRSRRHDGRTARTYVPRLVVWEITLACDLKCVHCGSRAGQARPDELDTDQALALIDELAALGCGEVVLVGGEAYLRNDFILLVRAIRQAGMSATMVTGGRNLDPRRCEALAEAGVSWVSVSIDGLEAAHDRLRGVAGSWRSAFEAFDHLRAAGIRHTCNTQINRLTRHDLLPLLLEHLLPRGLDAWQLQITAPFGNAVDHWDLLLQPWMYPELFRDLDRIADLCLRERIVLHPANNLGYFGPFGAKLRRLTQAGGHYRGCDAGRHGLGIEADGTIKNCPSLGGVENAAGRWQPGQLATMWNEAPQLTYMRERETSELWGYCASCYYADVCRGGCTAVSEPLLGRPGNNPFCHHRALEMERQGLRERVERVREAPGQPFDRGLFRVVREHIDPARRAIEGPVAIEAPRTSRVEDWWGTGSTVDV